MERGICRICGLEKELTYEHIPPRKSGNSAKVNAYNLDYLYVDSEKELLENLDKYTFIKLVEGKKYTKQHQQGFGIRGTCGRCNSTIKAVYDQEYINLTQWVLQQITQEPNLISEAAKSVKIECPFEFIPLYFAKCVLAMFAVLYGEALFERYADLRDFVMNADSLSFDSSKYKLYMYLLKSQVLYKCEPATVGSVATEEGKTQFLDIIDGKSQPPLTLEFGAHPFGFILDIDNGVTRKDLADMSPWITRNKYQDLGFHINAFFKNSPAPCQFA